MVTGRVLKYNGVRGYGFAAPDCGGEDVFIHVNDVEFDRSLLTAGARIDFSVEESGRGPKAARIQFVDGPSVPDDPDLDPDFDAGTGADGAPEAEAGPEPGGEPDLEPDDGLTVSEGLCDVLTVRDLNEEITEALLVSAPGMTAADILRARECLVRLAHGHGWLQH